VPLVALAGMAMPRWAGGAVELEAPSSAPVDEPAPKPATRDF
jgi:hypothetical protein